MNVTPDTLAPMVGASPQELRAFFRERYPSKAPGKGGRWRITLTMIIAAARHFR